MDTLKESSNIMCCKDAHRTLIEELRQCDFCSTSYEEHRRCWRLTARRMGEQAGSRMRS
jgi:hypothetical protein